MVGRCISAVENGSGKSALYTHLCLIIEQLHCGSCYLASQNHNNTTQQRHFSDFTGLLFVTRLLLNWYTDHQYDL